MAHLIGVVGVPGSGKSFLARSAAKAGETHVAIIDPKEEAFYASSGCKVELITDLDWRPHLREFNATGYLRLLKWLDARAKDASKFIVIDPMSEASDLILHEVLKVHQTNDPSDLDHGRAYTGHDQKVFSELLIELRRLHARGKTVIATFHAAMKELEGAGDATKQKAMSGQVEWKFDDQLLPAMNSSKTRQRVSSPFDLWLYTKPQGFGPGRKFYVTAIADQVRPAKHSVTFKAGVNPALLPNTIKDLLAAIEEPK